MKEMKNESIHTLLSLKKKGEDLNQQLKTVQGTDITTNEHGIKWDGELEKVFSYFMGDNYQLLLDTDYFYIKIDNEIILQCIYLIQGEQHNIYIDFNSIKEVEKQKEDFFILSIKKEDHKMETNEKRFVIVLHSKETPSEQDVARNMYLTGQVMGHQSAETTHKFYAESSYLTIMEALQQLERKQENEQEQWKLSDYIEEKLSEKGVSKSELAEKVGIKYKTLISKFKINSITGEELIRISMVLDLDLNEVKSVYMREEETNQVSPDKETSYIASLVKIGFTSGLVPLWELDIPQKQLYPLNKEEQQLVSEQIEKGYTTGYLKGNYPRMWKLKRGEESSLEEVKQNALRKYVDMIDEAKAE